MSAVRASVVQAASVAFDPEKTLEKLARLAGKAASDGARLAVFPEAFVSGYPRGLDFGARVGSRTDEGREDFRRYYQGAIEVPGPEVEAMEEVARENGLHLVVGVTERGGGTLYCSLVFLSPGSGYLGKHRKLMPTGAERLIWGYGDGSTLPVFDTPLGKLGGVICWENYMPMLRMAMYGKGIQIYCAPTADCRETWTSTMRHIALEGRCFVLGCNQYARRSDFPDEYDIARADDPDAVLCRGGSCIVDPLGTFLAGPDFEEECILTADLDMDQIARGKYDFDVVGHYSRPDVFRLHVNEEPMPPVDRSS